MRALAAIGLVLLLSACGGEAKQPAGAPEASLRITHVLDPNAKALYMEGSIWHLRVLDSEGNSVLDRKSPEDSLSMRLGAGRYRLESEELPCDGTCAHLDPAMDACSSEFSVQPGDRLAAKVILTPAQGCKVAF